MRHHVWKIIVAGMVLAGWAAEDAAAWGSRAQRAINGTAIQVVRRTYQDAFRTADNNYEEDVMRGAAADPAFLNESKPFVREEEAIGAISNEMQLLREVRQYGFGSYFSYRMGALAGLVADVTLPYALGVTAEQAKLKAKVEADIDAHVGRFTFTPLQKQRDYIRDAPVYFEQHRTFFSDGLKLIADDYQRGRGYEGYLKEAGQAYFNRSIEAIADAWHTVLRVRGEPSDVPPSQAVVTAYIISEINYLLAEKKNFHQACKTYETFERAGARKPEAYEKIGDLFYAFGTDEGKERGVREWKIAHEAQSADRHRVGKKLSNHYMRLGEGYLDAAARPRASEQELPNALNAFTLALEYDQTSDLAATRINETNAAIAERKVRRELNVNIIASAEKVKAQAEKSRLAKDYGNALATYDQVIGLYQAVDTAFADQASTAKGGIKQSNKAITDIINEVLDAASDSIDKGDKAVDEHKFEDATAAYERIANIVAVVPGDESTTHGKDKRTLIETAEKKKGDVKIAEQRWKETLRQREEAAKATAKAAGAAR